MRVNILRFQVRTEWNPRTKKGHPPHNTTGVASANKIHCIKDISSQDGIMEGIRSAVIDNINRGNVSTALILKR